MPFDPFFTSGEQLPVRPLPNRLQEAFTAAVKKDLKKKIFREPKAYFDPLSEEQRHLAAIRKAEAALQKPHAP